MACKVIYPKPPLLKTIIHSILFYFLHFFHVPGETEGVVCCSLHLTSFSLWFSSPFSHLTTHQISSSTIPVRSVIYYYPSVYLPFSSFLLLSQLTFSKPLLFHYSISRQSESGSTILRPLGRVLASSGRTNPLRTNLGRASANADGPCLFGSIRSAGCFFLFLFFFSFFFFFTFFSPPPKSVCCLAVGRSHPVLNLRRRAALTILLCLCLWLFPFPHLLPSSRASSASLFYFSSPLPLFFLFFFFFSSLLPLSSSPQPKIPHPSPSLIHPTHILWAD
ncbi:hypothetical protein BO85DRAFT_25644 [Aspergillus piperis CBS 112811]|uniref:T. brucei spp.-specific protein n=1 Tax=Aspergillus piperis CBS 112811 TaxID=1448313 RepID=A0A8G1VS31_9EURO|nr:hypothetical protein BO85DRAFT_25644 [Aspergillus piperis CBS 112811]RAH63531.1 hypothetical protein BO85DRAFT_25644 [Aspergillus piperis CBS 112811]